MLACSLFAPDDSELVGPRSAGSSGTGSVPTGGGTSSGGTGGTAGGGTGGSAGITPDSGVDASGGCSSGQTICPSGCTFTHYDQNNCGSCGFECPNNFPLCMFGKCGRSPCPTSGFYSRTVVGAVSADLTCEALPSGSLLQECVQTDNGDSGYLRATATCKAQFALGSLDVSLPSIQGVFLVANAKGLKGNETIRLAAVWNDVEYWSSPLTVPICDAGPCYSLVSHPRPTRPDGKPWTASDLANLRVALQAEPGASGEIRVTRLSIDVCVGR